MSALPALPPNLPSTTRAKLPATYEGAKLALAECTRIDECKDWADKAEALASYAKQAQDHELRKMADRIQARAIRRCGVLLRKIDAASGTRTDLQPRDGVVPRLIRTQAATGAGLSERPRKTAIRVSRVPDAEFEIAVESDEPPTVTDLARRGAMAKTPNKKTQLCTLRERQANAVFGSALASNADASPAAEPSPTGPSCPTYSVNRSGDPLLPLKQKWHKLTLQQKHDFLDWAWTRLVGEASQPTAPQSSAEAQGELSKPPSPAVQCKISSGCRYSKCRDVGHCLHVGRTTELTRLVFIVSKASGKQGQIKMTTTGRKTSDNTLKLGPDRRCGAPEALQGSSSRSASAFPITIAEWPRNGNELVRVRISQFNNSFTVDIRCWVRVTDGVFKPTRDGLTLGVGHLTKLDDALVQARDRAVLWGLLRVTKRRRATKE